MDLNNIDNSSDFKKMLKSEVDKANKRLSRMNKFQKSIFADKGITHISRAGGMENKLKALAQAKIVNESGISTATEYKGYVNQLSQGLSLSKKEVEYMLNSFDSETRDFISSSTLKYGSNPQIDFLYEDVISMNNALSTNLDRLNSYIESRKQLLDTVDILRSDFLDF